MTAAWARRYGDDQPAAASPAGQDVRPGPGWSDLAISAGSTPARSARAETCRPGGWRLQQRVEGYRHTLVAGQETYTDGEATDALPGTLIRGPRAAP